MHKVDLSKGVFEGEKDCEAVYHGLYDKNGNPIDSNGSAIGWPERAGQLEIINGQRLVVKQLLIEIVIPSQATPVAQYNFADQPLLRNAALWSLEFYTTSSIPISPISKNALVTDTMLGYMFLWMQLYANSYNFFQNKPCVTLKTQNNSDPGASYSFRNSSDGMIGQHVNWPNGYVIFSDATKIAATTAYSILIDVYYSLFSNWQMDGLGSTFGLR